MSSVRAVQRPIPASLLERTVRGRGFDEPATLRDVIVADEPVLVVFLRHYG